MSYNKWMKSIIILITIILSSSILFAAEEDDSTYVHGRAVIKVTSPFSQITVGGEGVVETEKGWFNQLAEEYEIYTLKKVFTSNNALFGKYYIIEFPEEYSVMDVCDDLIGSITPGKRADLIVIDDFENEPNEFWLEAKPYMTIVGGEIKFQNI